MTKPAFVYDNIFLNKDDYEFFQSLPNREKLLFLYDLCLEVEEFEEDNEEELFEPEEGSPNSFLTPKLLKFLEQASYDSNYVHILLLPDSLVISGNLSSTIDSTKKYLFNDGYIFTKEPFNNKFLDKELKMLQQYFKYVEVYKLLSIIHPSSLN